MGGMRVCLEISDFNVDPHAIVIQSISVTKMILKLKNATTNRFQEKER